MTQPDAPDFKVVIAPGAFKGSLGAMDVAESLAEGVRCVWPEARLVLLPLSDGGDGWVDTMVAAADGSFVQVDVTGPLGDPVHARYGMISAGGEMTAVIEMALASGLALVPQDRRDARRSTTYGTGELMRDALDRDVERILIGIGGSATNDGGAGMATALGACLTSAGGSEVPPGGAALAEVEHVDLSGLDPRLKEVEIVVASDVDNPLLGDDGASAVYGPQKGASPEVVGELDAALSRFADVVEDAVGCRLRDEPGAGAAGGLGFGLMAFCGAELRPGVELALDALEADRAFDGAAFAITAEGRIDAQTLAGKLPLGVARRAQRYGIPVVAVGGGVAPMDRSVIQRFHDQGIVLFSSTEDAASEEGLMDPDGTRHRLRRAAERIVRLVELGLRL